jgi:hypothetical protein
MLQRTLPAGFIAPCLPTKTDKLPSSSDWLHEIKHDGFRIIARKTVQRHRRALTAKEVFYDAPHSCIARAGTVHSSVVRPKHQPSHGSIWLYDRQ